MHLNCLTKLSKSTHFTLNVTDAGLPHLGVAVESLGLLNLSGTQVTDAESKS